MRTLPDSSELGLLDTASAELVDLIIDDLRDERGMHLPTATAAASALSGLSLLRATGVDLSALTPGTPVLVDALDDTGTSLVTFMSMICQMMGLDPVSGWSDPLPTDYNSLLPLMDLESRFEQRFVALAERQAVPAQWRPHLAALAAIKLIAIGRETLNPDIGKALILSTVVAASKTVPHQTEENRHEP